VLGGKGLTFSVMFARQMGKNQLSAVLEAYLLACIPQGTIIKAAPTFKPQVITSRMRLLSMLDNQLTRHRVWRSYGYMLGVAPSSAQIKEQSGPSIQFFSSSPEANIVGATASLLLEVDEAQDIPFEKFDRDLRPMASTTNATTVLYGTAWSDQTLLATVRAHNLELEQRDGIKRHFEYDWRTLAALNPNYRRFVEGEMQRLGEDHISIRTQYRLLTISGAGLLFSPMQRHLLQGSHAWEQEPSASGLYIAGMDVGGEQRAVQRAQGEAIPRGEHDSTIITIGKISHNELDLPRLDIVHQYAWSGKKFTEQYAETIAICEQWGITRLVIDKTGLGEGMASLLVAKLGTERVQTFHFTRPSKSKLTYQLLGLLNSSRLKLYKRADAPADIANECWKQLTLARYRMPSKDILDMYVDPLEGHDDFLMSLALCCEALKDWIAPSGTQIITPPSTSYGDGNY
jgi:hypothetical protein